MPSSTSDFAAPLSSNHDGTTVIGDPAPFDTVASLKVPKGHGARDGAFPVTIFFESGATNAVKSRPFFVPIDESTGGFMGALNRLDEELVNARRSRLVSKKMPYTWTGRTISPGEVGLYEHGGLPKLILRPGRYPRFPLANWFARTFRGTVHLSEPTIDFLGFTSVQVSQNQVAVIADPANQIFCVKNGGFVSLSLEGSYDVLAIVDQLNLAETVKDAASSEHRVLGWRQDVKMRAIVGGSTQEFVVATFLNIPANNVAVLQRGDDLQQLPAGQHVITDPSITVRAFFSKGESQFEMPARDLYTKDQVPVNLKVYLRWQLTEPLKLCMHGYSTPYSALKDKALSVLTQIVSHLEYASMIRARNIGPDNMEEGQDHASAAFLDALRTRALDDLHEAALEYGIILKDLAVLDRKFVGEIASTMDKLTQRSLQAQVEASNVEKENSNRVKKEEGDLFVAQVRARQSKTEADARAATRVATAHAEAEAIRIEAEARAEAVRLQARAESDAIAIRYEADRAIQDAHARTVQMARIEVSRIQAYGNKAVFVPSSSTDNGLSQFLVGASIGKSNATVVDFTRK